MAPDLLALVRSPAVVQYAGRALVQRDKVTLLDTLEGLPDMLSQLDIDPGHYQVELRFVRIDAASSGSE